MVKKLLLLHLICYAFENYAVSFGEIVAYKSTEGNQAVTSSPNSLFLFYSSGRGK